MTVSFLFFSLIYCSIYISQDDLGGQHNNEIMWLDSDRFCKWLCIPHSCTILRCRLVNCTAGWFQCHKMNDIFSQQCVCDLTAVVLLCSNSRLMAAHYLIDRKQWHRKGTMAHAVQNAVRTVNDWVICRQRVLTTCGTFCAYRALCSEKMQPQKRSPAD